MGPFGGAALKRCLILVGSGVASLLLASTVAVAFSHRLECRGRLAGNLNVCENALFFVRSAAVALCPKRCDIDDDRVVIVPFTPPCEASPLTTAGAPAVAMEATAGTTYGPSSFLQRTLSRFLTRDRDVTPSGSTAQNIGYRRVVAVMVTAGAIAVGLLLPYLIVARINGKKRRRGGNESSEGDKETCGVDRRWVSDSIQERQHRLLSATNSDPMDTRPSDANGGPSIRHPQFAMPMSKPVLLREQCGTKASAVGAKAAQHKQQQPLRLEEELAFGEVQWTQAPCNSHPPLTTSTPNNPPAIRAQRLMAQQRGQRSFKFPAGAASNLDLRKKIVASNAFNGSFNSVLPPSEETSVVDGDESMDLYNTAEEGVAEDFSMNPTALAPIKEPTADASGNTGLPQDDQHLEVVQGEGTSTEQWATTEEAIEDPYDEHDVVEVNQDEVVTDWGNDEVDFQEQQQGDDAGATVNETVEEGNEWAANDDEDPDNWLQEEHEEVNEGNANEGDFVAEDAEDLVAEGAVEEGESVEWAEEPEPDSEPITNEQMEEEREAAQDDGVTDEEAWNTVVATEYDDIESLGNDAVERTGDNIEVEENTQGREGDGTTDVEEKEELRDAVTSGALEDLEDIYVDDDDLNESNPNMMLIRRASETDDDDDLGEMIGFSRVPLLPDHESILSMDIPSTGPTSLRSNCTDPTDTEEDDEVCGGSGTGGVPVVHDDKNTVSAKAVTTAAAKRKADTFAQLTSKEELSQAKLILVNDRA